MHEERKKVWIDSFQTRLFLRMGWYWFIYQVALWNLVFVWRLLQEGPGNLLEQYGRFCYDYAPALVGCLLVLPVLALDLVRFAHRVVGPIYRFRAVLRSLAAGEPVHPVKLREDDFLTEMQQELNAVLDTLQRQGVAVLKPAGPDAKPAERQTA